MKADFYSKSQRANIYNSVFTYKVVSLFILFVITVILAYNYNKDKNLLSGAGGIIGLVTASIILFGISIILDFYILKRTAAIGIRLNKMAYLDRLTGLPNRYSCDLLFETFNDSYKLENAGFILMKINDLYNVNSKKGHAQGNDLIAEFCYILEDVGEKYGYVGRNGGNEFILLMEDCNPNNADMFLLDLTKRLHGYNELGVGSPIEIAYARVLNSDEKVSKISELISKAYKKLKEAPQVLS
ncbi:GGDEF domain-containing protein [Butyrivibrio sp. X503]|uniref:GGDEF domain-containing protein n=1 Tax=Butyrivibrio sp. X503 TaxID=2364878 RepID=UPI001314F3CA|nr:GGDEF domain-containing protein [Butyrivibrio sp. X503]